MDEIAWVSLSNFDHYTTLPLSLKSHLVHVTFIDNFNTALAQKKLRDGPVW